MGSFFKETRKMVMDYLETRLEIYRLQGVKAVSKTAAYIVWVIVSLFLLWLLLIFSGIVLGLWLSEVTGNYLTGFGITTLIILAFCILVYVFRKALFVNPIIRTALKHSQQRKEEEYDDDNED